MKSFSQQTYAAGKGAVAAGNKERMLACNRVSEVIFTADAYNTKGRCGSREEGNNASMQPESQSIDHFKADIYSRKGICGSWKQRRG